MLANQRHRQVSSGTFVVSIDKVRSGVNKVVREEVCDSSPSLSQCGLAIDIALGGMLYQFTAC